MCVKYYFFVGRLHTIKYIYMRRMMMIPFFNQFGGRYLTYNNILHMFKRFNTCLRSCIFIALLCYNNHCAQTQENINLHDNICYVILFHILYPKLNLTYICTARYILWVETNEQKINLMKIKPNHTNSNLTTTKNLFLKIFFWSYMIFYLRFFLL